MDPGAALPAKLVGDTQCDTLELNDLRGHRGLTGI